MKSRALDLALELVRSAIAGSGLPAFGLTLLACYELLLAALLLAPGGETGLGAFADEFRVWCFGSDPSTGRVDPAYVMGMTLPPLLVGALLGALWWQPLRAAWARPRALVAPALAAVAVTAAAAAGFASVGIDPPRGPLPFPAEALRTRHPAPHLELTAHDGAPVDLAQLRGRVVLLTAVYASCPHTCPAVLSQARSAVDALEPGEREDLRVIAVTLDAAHDTAPALAALAARHGLAAPLYRLVTGPPERVERTLDAMSIARRRDPATGIIDHANLFILVDRDGHVAYRFTLGDRQRRWLVAALRALLRERGSVG